MSASAFLAAIQEELGSSPVSITPGRIARFSCSGRPSDRSGWALLFEDGSAGVFGDWRQGDHRHLWTLKPRDRLSNAEREALSKRVELAKAQRERRQWMDWRAARSANAALWSTCHAVQPGDPVATYLHRRVGISVSAVPACIRLHRSLPYFDEGELIGSWPAMVAQLQAPDGTAVALHRTWLSEDGLKAPVSGSVKKLTPASGSLAGACIRLHWPALDRNLPRLGVAEGIETALAVTQACEMPTVAAYSAHALASWQWPAGVRSIGIFADHDRAGQFAAAVLHDRATGCGIHSEILTPSEPGADWCDVWAEFETSRSKV